MSMSAASPPESPVWRILLVDDEPTQRLIMARLLRRAGYEVDTASNGREALARIGGGDFQLMITDWEMPEMDGIALCSALRSGDRQPYIYTILLTARDAIEHVVTGLQAGADDYLTKPVVEPELIARLNTGKRIVTLERSLRTANEENRRLSITDPLTGAYNRRYLMEQLPREIERAARYGRQLAAIMCDVDHFKKINDSRSHQVGDEVLKRFVTHLQNTVRACDWVARYGGEEFVIVLPETTCANAAIAADHLRQQVADTPFDVSDGALTVTASFGVSGWKDIVPAGATLDALMAKCDEGVYASKAAGRNRVSAASLD
jgi:diguanylate cyclase (GGDEF)-like protein